jgi:hypothetical protein
MIELLCLTSMAQAGRHPFRGHCAGRRNGFLAVQKRFRRERGGIKPRSAGANAQDMAITAGHAASRTRTAARRRQSGNPETAYASVRGGRPLPRAFQLPQLTLARL